MHTAYITLWSHSIQENPLKYFPLKRSSLYITYHQCEHKIPELSLLISMSRNARKHTENGQWIFILFSFLLVIRCNKLGCILCTCLLYTWGMWALSKFYILKLFHSVSVVYVISFNYTFSYWRIFTSIPIHLFIDIENELNSRYNSTVSMSWWNIYSHFNAMKDEVTTNFFLFFFYYYPIHLLNNIHLHTLHFIL